MRNVGGRKAKKVARFGSPRVKSGLIIKRAINISFLTAFSVMVSLLLLLLLLLLPLHGMDGYGAITF